MEGGFMNKWILGALCFSSTLFAGASRTEVQFSVGEDDGYYYDDEPPIWIGPGWYYGIWFGNEADYDNWNHYHHHRYEPYDHHDGHRGGYHDGGHHGGGGHR